MDIDKIEWFCNTHVGPEEKLGPLSLRQLAVYWGPAVDERCLVWREGMAQWTTMLDIPSLVPTMQQLMRVPQARSFEGNPVLEQPIGEYQRPEQHHRNPVLEQPIGEDDASGNKVPASYSSVNMSGWGEYKAAKGRIRLGLKVKGRDRVVSITLFSNR